MAIVIEATYQDGVFKPGEPWVLTRGCGSWSLTVSHDGIAKADFLKAPRIITTPDG